MRAKSTPPVPDICAATPSNSTVVAPPRTLGPTTENTTDSIASTTAATSPTQYGPR